MGTENPLGPKRLIWLREHLRLGDNFIFAEMEQKKSTSQKIEDFIESRQWQ